jgi:hypothetical protein
MDLLERYLQAVRKYLPWTLSRPRQDDIIAELRANLESQLEEREADLGRPLTQGEMVDWLKQLGAPIQVASRYMPAQYLIGPTLFPMYLYVLRLALIISLIIYAVVSVILYFASSQVSHVHSLVEAVARTPRDLFITAASVTLVFAVIEFITNHYPHLVPQLQGSTLNWNPAALPPLDRVFKKHTKNFAQIVAQVVFEYIFLVWLLLIPYYPVMVAGPGAGLWKASAFMLAPDLWFFYWVCVGLHIVQLAWNTTDLILGSWRTPSLVKPVVFKLMGIIPAAVLLAMPDRVYLLLRHPAADTLHYSNLLDEINTNIWRGVAVILAILLIQLAWEIIQAVRENQRTA